MLTCRSRGGISPFSSGRIRPKVRLHTNLRKLLHELRRTLPEPERFLRYADDTIQWNPDSGFHADVSEFGLLKLGGRGSP